MNVPKYLTTRRIQLNQYSLKIIQRSWFTNSSYPALQPRQLGVIGDRRLPPLLKLQTKRPPPRSPPVSPTLTTLSDYQLGFDTSKFGEYQVLVPKDLKLGVPEVDVDLVVPITVTRPRYAYTKDPGGWGEGILIKSEDMVVKMRKAGQLASKILQLGGSLCKPGVTTAHIDNELRHAMFKSNCYPSPLNYMGFPASICTSVNNVICHGIPDSRRLVDGDIINIDVTVYLDGFHGDTSATFLVGEHVDELGKTLVHHTKQALDVGISVCGPGVPFSAIGHAISQYARQHGYAISEEFTGHGIGTHFHENPLIFHHQNNEEGVMRPNMTFTIEPMLCQGSAKGTVWPDGWTIVTEDGGRSAQFEHTVRITNTGVEILTQ